MKLEYLFEDKKNREEIEAFKPTDSRVQKEFFDIENTDCWTVVFRSDGDSLSEADQLSDIHECMIARYHPIVLTNDSSAFFNQALYPLFNDFERKLRKLLYLMSALNPRESGDTNIGCLEEQDLGSIFEMLFTDTDFIMAAKQRINEKAWKYTKEEILETLSAIPENVLWDSLIGSGCVPTLRKRFFEVRQYRNDTMHAHNMNGSSFKKAMQLIEAVNHELDAEIGNTIGRKAKRIQTETDKHFNSGMANALSALRNLRQSENREKPSDAAGDRFSELFPVLFR